MIISAGLGELTSMIFNFQRVYWWFFNHSRASTSGMDTRGTLKLSAKSKVLQPYQAYSQLYYNSKLKPVIDEMYQEHLESMPIADQKTRFVFTATATKELYEAET